MMLGDSAGRSARHRTGEGARRRNTPRERAQIDPPWDQVVPRFPETKRDYVGMLLVTSGVSATAGAVLGVLLSR